MRLIVAKGSGFCFGVKRALEIVEKTLRKEKGPFYTLGPLIHNPQVVERLSRKGLKVIDNFKGIKRGIFVIRCHGLASEIIAWVKKKDLKIIDTTCPYVIQVKKKAKEIERKGKQLIIIGDRNHPEVKGMASKKSIILQNVKEAKALVPPKKEMGVVVQTTQSEENFKRIVEELKKKKKSLLIYNTICQATIVRQKETAKLAKKVNLMLIVGGRNSANTRRLAQMSKGLVKTYHIEEPSEIDKRWLRDKKVIGVSAGASTPEWLIDEVIRKVASYGD